MGRIPYMRMLGVTLVLATITSLIMVNIHWDGLAASTARHDIDHLLNIMIVLSAFVFWGVMVALGYALWKFRAKPGDEGDGEPIHGNTRLEVAWTLIPTIIVLFGGGYSWHVLNKIEKHDPDRMVMDVYSQQYNWNFVYPDADRYSSGEFHVPVDRQVEFKLHALDVLHSFWVPEWGIKKDNVPGITTRAYVTPDKEGTYQLVCTELCGFGHAAMRATVVVESKADFHKWLVQQEKTPDAFAGPSDQVVDPGAS